jgi:predicted tellurium resistance membrane protein TerC
MVWLRVIRLAAVTVVASFTTRVDGRRLFTPMVIVISAIGLANVIFALDSIPAIFGLTQDPYIVFTANAFALMGLRQLYFLIGGLLERIIYLNIGLSVILAFIGVKLIIEALHGSNVDAIGLMHLPEIGIAASVGFIIVTLAVTTVSSLGKSSYHRRQLQANPVRSAELVPANDQQTDAVGT